MRVCIIGIDALEYDLVKKWNLKNLKQKEYGKINLLVDPRYVATPIIWTSFITGKRPEEHGIISDRKWDNKFIEIVSRFKKHLLKTFDFRIFPLWANRNLPQKFGIEYKPIDKKDLKFDTIFDLFSGSIAIGVPCYNEWEKDLKIRNMLIKSFSDRLPKKDTKKFALEVFKLKKRETFKRLKENWEIFMTYFYVLDPIQHLFHYDEGFIKDMYEKVDSTVSQIKEKIGNKCLILIIGDHGQKEGEHTNYGFYSSNKKLGLKNPKITDFYGLIKKWLGAPSKEDEEKIKKRLEILGY